jgi:ribose-phosphate pyrophosphokinase
VHYFEGECLRFELYAEPILTAAISELNLSNFMFGSADLGRPLWVETFAKKFGTKLALVRKSRDSGEPEVTGVVGKVNGRTVVIYDDMIRSAKTLVGAAEAYLAKGALDIYAVSSHLALTGEEAIALLEKSPIKKIISTNSHSMSQHRKVAGSSKFVVKDVSGLFLDAILRLR